MSTKRLPVFDLDIRNFTKDQITDCAQLSDITTEQALDKIVQEWAELKNRQEPQDNESTFDSDALVEKLELLTSQSQQLYEDISELYQKMRVQFPPF